MNDAARLMVKVFAVVFGAGSSWEEATGRGANFMGHDGT
jgi:hypothetical protein